MSEIIIKRMNKPLEDKVIKIKGSTYVKLLNLSEQAGISMSSLATKLLDISMENVTIIDEEEETNADYSNI